MLKIRSYKANDKPKLLTLLRLNTPEYFDESELGDFAHYLDHNREDYFVAEMNDTVIGCGGINYEPSRAVISWDIIHPEFHKKGVGRELTKFRIRHLKSKPEVEEIAVRTSQMSYGFYQKLGFELQHTKKDFWAQGFDLYYMTLQD